MNQENCTSNTHQKPSDTNVICQVCCKWTTFLKPRIQIWKAQVEMCGITDPFISRNAACSPTHSASGTYLLLPLRPAILSRWPRGAEFSASAAAQKGTSYVLPTVYTAFWALQDNNFYNFYHSWMYYLYLQVVKSIFTVNDKGISCFLQSLPCCKSTCEVAGKGRIRQVILEFSLWESSMCTHICLEWVGAHESLVIIYAYTCIL